MKAFITGITGFAGSHLAEYLLDCGDAVLGSSQSGTWRDDAPSQLLDRVKVIPWDVRQGVTEPSRRLIAEFAPDWIFHLAAMSVPSDCGHDEPTPEAVATNVMGTSHTLHLASSLAIPPRVLLASSCYVYSAVDESHPQVDERAPLGPSAGYGKTKLAAEREMALAWKNQNVEGIIARAFQHTGARQSPRMIVPQWVQQFIEGGSDSVEVKSLQTYLDLSDVRDIARAYRALALRGKCGEIYNVGSGVCSHSGDIFERLRQMIDPSRGVSELAPSHRQHPIADIQRIKEQTLWQPEISLDSTLSDICDYWKRRKMS